MYIYMFVFFTCSCMLFTLYIYTHYHPTKKHGYAYQLRVMLTNCFFCFGSVLDLFCISNKKREASAEPFTPFQGKCLPKVLVRVVML